MTGVLSSSGRKFGDWDEKFGEEDDVELNDALSGTVEAEKFGETDMFESIGRNSGIVVKESVRFDSDCAVANKAGKSGDVEPIADSTVSCTKLLGHIASAPSST